MGGVTRETLTRALVNATCTAAYVCEAFSVNRLQTLTRDQLNERAKVCCNMLP